MALTVDYPVLRMKWMEVAFTEAVTGISSRRPSSSRAFAVM